MNLQLIAKAVLILWLVRNFVVFFLPTGGAGGLGAFIGGTVGDLRVWLLVIGLVLLHYRDQKTAQQKLQSPTKDEVGAPTEKGM